jgi:hypothetical protein
MVLGQIGELYIATKMKVKLDNTKAVLKATIVTAFFVLLAA